MQEPARNKMIGSPPKEKRTEPQKTKAKYPAKLGEQIRTAQEETTKSGADDRRGEGG